MEHGLDMYGEKINKVREAYFYSNIAVLYFGLEQYSKALKWINKLIADEGINEGQDIHCISRIINLIIHLELGNRKHIPTMLTATIRYLSKRKRVYKFEKVMLDFFRKMDNEQTKQENLKMYKELIAALKTLQTDNFEKTVFEFFDFVSWAESKVENNTFQEIVQRKAALK